MTQNGMQYETYELFLSGIFHFIFSDCGALQMTEVVERKTVNNGGLFYHFPSSVSQVWCEEKKIR